MDTTETEANPLDFNSLETPNTLEKMKTVKREKDKVGKISCLPLQGCSMGGNGGERDT